MKGEGGEEVEPFFLMQIQPFSFEECTYYEASAGLVNSCITFNNSQRNKNAFIRKDMTRLVQSLLFVTLMDKRQEKNTRGLDSTLVASIYVIVYIYFI